MIFGKKRRKGFIPLNMMMACFKPKERSAFINESIQPNEL